MKKIMSVEEEARKARIEAVEAEIEAAEVKREEDEVVETEEETKVREADEARRLAEAKGGVAGVATEAEVDAKVHTDARDARLATHKANVETARLARVELEKTGVVESEGAKLDREAKEAKDLEVAEKLYVNEPIALLGTQFGNGDMNALRDKVNELIKVNNKRG